MVKKSTLILLILFAVSVAILIYLQRTPAAEFGNQPTPTLPTFLVTGWTSDRVSTIELTPGKGNPIVLSRNSDQVWSQKDSPDPIDQGKVAEFIANLQSLRVGTSLDVATPLESIGLAEASNMIMVKDASGAGLIIRIGSLAPTGSSYYIQLDTSTPVACDRTSVDSLLNYFAPGAFSKQIPTPEGLQLTPAGP